MTVFFDKSNFFSLFKILQGSEREKDVLRFLKRQVDIHFNFSIEELDEHESIIIEEFQEGVAKLWKWTHGIDKIMERPLKINSFPEKSGIYLLDDENVEPIKRKHLFIIGKVSEEEETLNQLIFDKYDYGYHTQKIIGSPEFDTWDKVENFCLPFSTVLFVDRFMFKGPEIGGNLGLFDFNIGTILKNLFQNKLGPSRLIFVYRIVDNVASTNPAYDLGPNLDTLKNKIKRLVKGVNKYCPDPEFIFIGVPKDKIKDEHDRHIIANYIRIKSGDSLIYFNSAGVNVSNSNEIDFFSLGKKEYRETTDSLLHKLNCIIKDSYLKYPQYCYCPSNISIESVINFL
jgi:hypothetical protein